jgi:hypothetical protein
LFYRSFFKILQKITFRAHKLSRILSIRESFCARKFLCAKVSALKVQALLVLSVTVELNPGPVKSKKSNFSFAVWNLDSIPAREYARIPLIETFQSTYNVDIFGV